MHEIPGPGSYRVQRVLRAGYHRQPFLIERHDCEVADIGSPAPIVGDATDNHIKFPNLQDG
ncbi:hypothetical protein D3C71_1696980 [compost metagenome]